MGVDTRVLEYEESRRRYKQLLEIVRIRVESCCAADHRRKALPVVEVCKDLLELFR